MSMQQFAFQDDANGHGRLDTGLTACPLCDRPFTDDDQAARVHAKHEAQERAQAQNFGRQLHEQVERARNEATAAALAASKDQIDALVADNARLNDNLEATVREQTDALVAAERLQLEAQYAADAALRFQENEKLKKQVGQLTRALDERKAYDLGEGAEIDQYHALRAAFPGDRITRVGKGVEGADIEQIVVDKGQECGKILHESKNRKNWSDRYAVKLRADKIAAEADYAVLSTCAFPPGTDQIEIREEVIVCKPKRVVSVTRILRQAIILAALRDGGKDADKKLSALFTSGVGRELLMSASDDVDKLRALDTAHAKHTKKILEDRGKVYAAQEQKFANIFAAIDRIIQGEADGEAAFAA
jgi:hypothetical protein